MSGQKGDAVVVDEVAEDSAEVEALDACLRNRQALQGNDLVSSVEAEHDDFIHRDGLEVLQMGTEIVKGTNAVSS